MPYCRIAVASVCEERNCTRMESVVRTGDVGGGAVREAVVAPENPLPQHVDQS